ncbi:hypothetical protein GPUN_2461 [Glaciecola punicea ACAM 611]|uniref:Uncharacterized protein n=1 Tax=Glaciecola punicea ACAM 611 TaxID=1121923 RepID=H5TE49_9ALTE|nr:YacL family protein [Glaciecola punicea]OFA31110.1 hypothetical protein BAE46_09050 [Glaciecola punicea]GAB56576.1 hypothetical protein GPUN_2461 [Glaciecola punicea ACAM 611]
MDYKFFRDVSGKPTAECEEEAATFGDWLSNELSGDDSAVADVLVIIEQLQTQAIKTHKIKGHDYTLVLDQDEAELHRHLGYWDEDTPLPEGTELDLQDDVGCGLQDLKELLLDWQDFVKDTKLLSEMD